MCPANVEVFGESCVPFLSEGSLIRCVGWEKAKHSNTHVWLFDPYSATAFFFAISLLLLSILCTFFCLIHPIAIVFEVILFCVLCFFSPHKVVDVVFPSFLWSSDWSSCSDFVVRTRMPIKDLTCPFLSCSTSSFCVSLSSKVFAFFQVFFGVFSASFDELNPFLFFFTVVIFFITVFLDRNKHHCLDLCRVLFGALSSFFVGHAMRIIFFLFSRSSC